MTLRKLRRQFMKKLYLLDANTLIDAKNHYYPIDRVPEFWSWLIHQGQLGNIKIPIEIYEEFKDTRSKKGEQDELAFWASQPHVKEALLLNENAESNTVIDVPEEMFLKFSALSFEDIQGGDLGVSNRNKVV